MPEETTGLGRMFRRLKNVLNELAEDGNGPQPPEVTAENAIDEVGEQDQRLTSFGYMRDLLPTLRVMTPPQPGAAMTPDEVVAWDMLQTHRFSRALMREEGVLSDFEALGVKPETEYRWRSDWVRDMLAAFETRPEAMDAVLLTAAEYGDAEHLLAALDALDDAISEQHVPDAALLDRCTNAGLAIGSGAFDADAEQADEARAELGVQLNRLETRLRETDPDGAWRALVGDIRSRL